MSLEAILTRQWHIYKITNPEGRVYIGRTSSIRRRRWCHFSRTQYRNKFIAESTSNFGEKAHSFEVIDSFEGSEVFANGKEMFWIRTYMSNFNKWPERMGMNLTDGGKSLKGYKFSKESIDKKNAKTRGVHKDVNHLTRYHTGIKQNKTWVENRAKAAWKPVLMYDMNMSFVREFESVDQAYAFFGKKKGGHIGAVCSGKRDHIYKHIFKFKK